jgi:crossover junction endodeoxyribonuclease RusA
MTTTLTLPYPISANRYWATRVIKRKGAKFSTAMTYVTPEAEQYKRAVGSIAIAAGLRTPHAGRVALLVRLFPDRPQDWARRSRKDPDTWDDGVRCIDLGNCEKVLSDALNGIAWADDKQLRRIVLERCEPDEKGARVEVEITALSAAPIAPELFAGAA